MVTLNLKDKTDISHDGRIVCLVVLQQITLSYFNLLGVDPR